VTPVLSDDPSGSAGNANLIAGDMTAGYFGTVSAGEFIDGDTLASEVGLTAGTSQHSNTDWLKFSSEGKPIFSPLKPVRYSLSWDDINAVDLVYGNKTVVIDGLTYKVRLWQGAETNPSNSNETYEGAVGSEWNSLMLPIHTNAPSSWLRGYGYSTEDWGINFTDNDLITHRDAGEGASTLCQEVWGSDASERVRRGWWGVADMDSISSSTTVYGASWRPVLELVQ
jgi:hypothetical protein